MYVEGSGYSSTSSARINCTSLIGGSGELLWFSVEQPLAGIKEALKVEDDFVVCRILRHLGSNEKILMTKKRLVHEPYLRRPKSS